MSQASTQYPAFMEFQICVSYFTCICWIHNTANSRPDDSSTVGPVRTPPLLLLFSLYCSYSRDNSLPVRKILCNRWKTSTTSKINLALAWIQHFFLYFPFQWKDLSCYSDSSQIPTCHLSLNMLSGFHADITISLQLMTTWCIKQLTSTKR